MRHTFGRALPAFHPLSRAFEKKHIEKTTIFDQSYFTCLVVRLLRKLYWDNATKQTNGSVFKRRESDDQLNPNAQDRNLMAGAYSSNFLYDPAKLGQGFLSVSFTRSA